MVSLRARGVLRTCFVLYEPPADGAPRISHATWAMVTKALIPGLDHFETISFG